jgi:hypothetical protein
MHRRQRSLGREEYFAQFLVSRLRYLAEDLNITASATLTCRHMQ